MASVWVDRVTEKERAERRARESRRRADRARETFGEDSPEYEIARRKADQTQQAALKASNKTRAWRVNWREGTRHRTRTFSVDVGKAVVDRYAAEKRAQLSAPEYQEAPDLSMDAVIRHWKQAKLPELAPNTRYNWEVKERKWFTDDFRRLRLQRVSGADITRLLRQVAAQSGTPTVESVRTVLLSVFDFAVAEEWISKNPVPPKKLMPKGRAGKQKRRAVGADSPIIDTRYIFSPEQFALIIATFDPHWAPLVRTLGVTGMRIGEASALAIEDIDFESGKLRIVHSRSFAPIDVSVTGVRGELKMPKTLASARILKLPPALLSDFERLAEGRDPSEPLFVGPRGGVLDPGNFRKDKWNPVVEQLGLAEFVPHDLRHYCASRLISKGVNLKAICEWMGHADPSITLRIYSRLFESDQDGIVQVLEEDSSYWADVRSVDC